MSVAEIKTHFTPDDLRQLPDAVKYELVNWMLVERHTGSESSIQRPANAPAGPIGVATVRDTTDGEDILPGFTCHAAEFFEI